MNPTFVPQTQVQPVKCSGRIHYTLTSNLSAQYFSFRKKQHLLVQIRLWILPYQHLFSEEGGEHSDTVKSNIAHFRTVE